MEIIVFFLNRVNSYPSAESSRGACIYYLDNMASIYIQLKVCPGFIFMADWLWVISSLSPGWDDVDNHMFGYVLQGCVWAAHIEYLSESWILFLFKMSVFGSSCFCWIG